MSIGHMPEPLDTLTSKTPAVHNAEALSGAAAEAEQGANTARPTDLMEQIAEIIEEQADLIAQKLVYTSQQMYGVSAVGVDFVNARNSALAMAKALRSGVLNHAEKTLVNLGDSQIEQVNDQTLPYKHNALVAGLLEGILLDTVMRALGDDPARKAEARKLLDSIFVRANERAERQPLAMFAQWPGGGPNARS